MKKILLSLIGAALLMALHAQSPTLQDRGALNLSSLVGYPLTIGDATTDQMQVAVNKLVPVSVELDSMARYQIGAIPDQTVWHNGDVTVGFYVLTDTLKAQNVTLSYSIDSPPEGEITFDNQTGRFKYSPDKADARNFTITFRAESNGNMIVQDVVFNLMPATPPEYAAFGVDSKAIPDSTDDYTIISQTVQKNVQFNNALRDTVYSISITGKDLVFDSHVQNKLLYLTGREDISELNIFAERVVVRDALHFPQTNVTVYAKELVFEDLPGQEKASINTSPVMFDVLASDVGQTGANAGNITLYIQNYAQSVPAKRFILVGGKGQNVPWDTEQTKRTPGNGGNGGTLTSTINVSDFYDAIHGSAGIRDSMNLIVGAGQQGQDGNFVFYDKEFTWLHPNFISAVVKHAKDAYLNINNGFTYNIFSQYIQRIEDMKSSAEWGNLDNATKMDLNNEENEMQAIVSRIGQNLDYFGNPVGWVPMLSFEVNKAAFEQEIGKAIRVMYLSYWLKNINGTNEQRINACNDAIQQVKQDLSDNKDLVNQLALLIPELQDEATVLGQQIDDLVIKINQKTNQLLAQAKSNVKKQNEWGVVCGVLTCIAKAAPVVCSVIPGVGTAIGVGIGAALSVGTNALANATNANPTYIGYGAAVGDFIGTATNFFSSGGFSDITKALNQIDITSLGAGIVTIDSAYNSISKTVDPLVKGVDKLRTALTQNSTPNSQVQAELDKLKAQSREYQELIAEADALNTQKEELMSKLSNTLDNFTTTSVEVQKNIAAVDGLNSNVFNGNSQLDLRAMQYVDDMDRRAKERLLKYHYYMAKAYEYRLLQSYPGELNLPAIMDRLVAIAGQNPDKPTLDDQDFSNLEALYEDQLSTVTSSILTIYNSNRPELTQPFRFDLTADDLAALNSGGDVRLNIYERGMIAPNQENVRIVNFKVYSIKVHLEGDQNPSFANFNLLMEHSGRSMIRSNGQIYWFDHVNNQTQNPITWGMAYDAKRGIVDEQTPSFASNSLLYSLLGNLANDNIMIYSRPGAWADIRISKSDVTSGNTKMVIDSLTFELQYDFTQRPTNNRNLDVYAGDVDNSSTSLSPYIELSRTDKGGRDNGRGVLYRTYSSGSSVNLETPADYGRYKFVNWTDQFGGVASTLTTVSANMSSDIKLRANYKYTGPILSVEDSVIVGKSAQVIAVKVENKGSEEMDWEAVSNDPWIKILSGGEGTDTGYITLEIEQNPSETFRNGSITITAPETAEYAKDIKIVQSNENVTDLKQAELPHSPKIIRYPGTNTYSVLLDETARNISVDVYTVSGQLVLKKYFYGTSTFDFDLSHCNQGVYLVKITYDGKNCVQKLIK